ncbi:MAG: hypothetical protein CMJ51_00805 [Planctomycetaceae bacterium]|nr:hypothetical protein [Planctomycetaceae bacterium]
MTPSPQADRPVLVISDLHLGRTGMTEKAEELAPLIDAASTLVINGDVAELHVRTWAKDAARELDRLRERCRRSGTHLVVLAGNHDPEITDRRHLILSRGELLITHGDVVHESLAPWSDAAEIIRARHREFLEALAPSKQNDLTSLFQACREAAKAECETLGDLGPPTTPLGALSKPWKLLAISRFWWSHARKLDRFATTHAPTSRMILAGHSHRAGVERVGRRTIVNTGCFGVPGPALGVILGSDGLEVRRIVRHRRRGERSLGPGVLHRDAGIRIEASELPTDDFAATSVEHAA